mgnify:CR=1 FL=1
MQGTADVIKYINRDELTHVLLFGNLIKGLKAEGAMLPDDFVYDMFDTAVKQEIEWAQHILGDEIIGINGKTTEQYTKQLANKRLTSLGYKPLYEGFDHNPYTQFEKINSKELNEDLLKPLQEDLNTPEYIAKLHSLFEDSSKGNKSSKVKFLSACQQIGLLEDKKSWQNFKKSKVKIDENFINQKIQDRNKAREKGNYKLADSLRKELEDNGVIIEDKQEKTTWKYK